MSDEHPVLRLRRVMNELKKHATPSDFKFTEEEWDHLTNKDLVWQLTRFWTHENGQIYNDHEWEVVHNHNSDHRSKRTRITCSFCGKDASWNTPWTDGHDKVMCDSCAALDNSDTIWYGINQHRSESVTSDHPFNMDPQRMRYRYKSVILHVDQVYNVTVHEEPNVRHRFTVWHPRFTYRCWIEDGHQAMPLTIEEQNMWPNILVVHIWNTYCSPGVERYRCTSCGETFEGKPCGYPLFAGAVCCACWKEHKEKLEEERRRGHVCRMCGQPYGNCSC